MNQSLKIIVLSALSLISLSAQAGLHEAFETVAVCVSSDPAKGDGIKVMDSTSSVRAVLELTRASEPGAEPSEVQHIYGVKDDTVRDPIVYRYEFDGYELLISLERHEDGHYPASLTVNSPKGDRNAESFDCNL